MLRDRSRKSTSASPPDAASDSSSGRSAPVITAFTPSIRSAAETSRERIRAWAWGERNTAPISIPGRAQSAPKRARPVTLSSPSWRTGRVPTHL